MSDKVIAIDCGGTNLRVAVVDSNLKIGAVRRVKTIRDNPTLLYETMHKLIEECRKEDNIEVNAIGVSICGIVSNNIVGRCGNLGITSGFDLYSYLKKDYPNAFVKIANDGNCSALAESAFGTNKDVNDSAFVTISSGIGLGLVHNKEMLDLPLEGGRMMIEYKNKMYEAEYLLSGNGIVRLCKLEGLEIENAADFFIGVREKKEKYREIYNIWLRLLGTWFANLHLLFNCDRYAISGGVIKSADVFFDDLAKVANAAIASWHLKPIVFKIASFSQDVGLAGAASLAILRK